MTPEQRQRLDELRADVRDLLGLLVGMAGLVALVVVICA